MRSNLFIKWDLYAFQEPHFRKFCKTHDKAFLCYMLVITALYQNEGKAIPESDLVDNIVCQGLVTEPETRFIIRTMLAEQYHLLTVTKDEKLFSKRVNSELSANRKKSDKARASVNVRWNKSRQSNKLQDIRTYNERITNVIRTQYYKEEEQEQENIYPDIFTAASNNILVTDKDKQTDKDKLADCKKNQDLCVFSQKGNEIAISETYIANLQSLAEFKQIDVFEELKKLSLETQTNPNWRPLESRINLNQVLTAWLRQAVKFQSASSKKSVMGYKPEDFKTPGGQSFKL